MFVLGKNLFGLVCFLQARPKGEHQIGTILILKYKTSVKKVQDTKLSSLFVTS
jgi:hypothetical protein